MKENFEKQLTVIIPFLNEREEVRNTLQSIRENGGKNISVILINDASDDEYDYKSIAGSFGVEYILNSERQGVARSRDIGIERCQTPYFLILDAHMRFYQEDWEQILVNELKKDERVLLCCNSTVLYRNEWGEVHQNDQGRPTFGAIIDMARKINVLDVEWNVEEKDPCQDVEDISCVLGAAYAGSKRYWQYLRGLEGLIYYGSDEAYISLKVWLEGGRCRLLKTLFVGHIYRHKPPYPVEGSYVIYNKLLIAYLLFPTERLVNVFGVIQQSRSHKLFSEVFNQLMEKKAYLDELKTYYQQIFTRDFDYVISQNKKSPEPRDEEEDENLLSELFSTVLLNCNVTPGLGIENGRMGCILFLASYARYKNENLYEELAGKLLDELYEKMTPDMAVTWKEGVCGIAFGIMWLLVHHLVEGEPNEILEEIDARIMEREPERIMDYSWHNGLAGILYYVLYRLQYWTENGGDMPFDSMYLKSLERAAQKAIWNVERVEALEMSVLFIEWRKGCLKNLQIPDVLSIVNMSDFFDYNRIVKSSYGLKFGCAGLGLNILRTRTNLYGE